MSNEHTIIASRTTFDGVKVCLWSDGLLTWAMGYSIKGVGTSRKPEQKELNLRAGWLVMGEVCLYERAEVSTLVKVARRAVRQSKMPAPLYLRTKITEALEGSVMDAIVWTVTSTDRDGRTTERTGTFARLSGLAHVVIFDSRRDYNRHGGRYGVHYLTADRKSVRPGPPAFVAKNQREIAGFLGSLLKASAA